MKRIKIYNKKIKNNPLWETKYLLFNFIPMYVYRTHYQGMDLFRYYFIKLYRNCEYTDEKPGAKPYYVTLEEYLMKWNCNRHLVPLNYDRGFVKDLEDDQILTYDEAEKKVESIKQKLNSLDV